MRGPGLLTTEPVVLKAWPETSGSSSSSSTGELTRNANPQAPAHMDGIGNSGNRSRDLWFNKPTG